MVDTSRMAWHTIQTMPLRVRASECRRRWHRAVDQALVILSVRSDDATVHADVQAEADLLDVCDASNAMGWFEAGELWLKRSREEE